MAKGIETNFPNIVSYGGGIQSTALAALIVLGRLPVPDMIVFVDTGYECSHTLSYMKNYVAPAIEQLGKQISIVNRFHYTDFDLFWSETSLAPVIPCFIKEDGKVSRLRNLCTDKWKTYVFARYLEEKGIKSARVWVGISTDEAKRAREIINGPKVKSRPKWYPLLELGLSREDCYRVIAEIGWPCPKKSRCYICPNQTREEWLEVIESEDWLKLLEVERRIREVRPNVWFNRYCIPMKEYVEALVNGQRD